jgi:hypothetical protein
MMLISLINFYHAVLSQDPLSPVGLSKTLYHKIIPTVILWNRQSSPDNWSEIRGNHMQLENHKYSQGLKLTAKQNTVDLMHTCMTLLQGGIYNVQRLHHTNPYRNQLPFS